ncbi:MAG: hypothetical protein ACRDT4_01155 [Micromonosporaceae bacterium]
MVDVADSEGKVTRVNSEGLDTWLTRVGRVGAGLAKTMHKQPEGASTVVGKDARLRGGRVLGLRNDAALAKASEVSAEIARLVIRLRNSGRHVVAAHTSADATAADGIGRATD